MDSSEKYLFMGAFVAAGVDLALEAYWAYNEGKSPGSMANKFPYVTVGTPYLPPGDDWIAGAGTPLFLYLLGRGLKKESLKTIAKGAAIYGGSMLAGVTTARVAIFGTGTWKVTSASMPSMRIK